MLTEELLNRGHEVTLFASGDSETSAYLYYTYDEAQTEQLGWTAVDALHVSNALSQADRFDLIHDHSGFLAVAFARFVSAPLLHTLHGPFEEKTKDFYGRVRDECWFNAITEYQRSCFPGLNYVDTVYNAVDIDSIPFKERKEGFLLHLSRVSEAKGTHLAIEVAKRAGRRLVIAGKVDPVDSDYFDSRVKPEVDGERIVFLGEVDGATKRRLMTEAACFVFPIQWPEPFGLVMVEAMAAGTPVVALGKGSVPEIVEDGLTGYVVESLDQMVDALGGIDSIDPKRCRESVERRFNPRRMTDGYERNYRRVLENEARRGGGARGPEAA